MSQIVNKRKLRNILVDKSYQVPFTFGYVLIFTLGTLSTFICFTITALHMADSYAYFPVNPQEMQAILQYVWLVSVPFIACVGLFLIPIGILYSHRISGSEAALIRQIKKLASGDYESDLILRKNSKLKNACAALNKLTHILRDKQQVGAGEGVPLAGDETVPEVSP